MRRHIAAARDCILQVTNYIKHTNPNFELRVGFCGYRDHNDKTRRLKLLEFTDQYEQFTKYMKSVSAFSSLIKDDLPEDVLGGLNAAITQLDWKSSTRVLLHIGDYPPHGHRFSNIRDKYPNGDPYGLTAESVLKMMQSKNILYFFGRITSHTDTMLQIFHNIIGEFPELRPTLEAFVHFTYEYTKGYLVVCDLQGIEHNDEFLLTDPSIHCINPLRFGRTNFGKEGIK
ncbi:hypothetical protein RhiirA5_450597 [Rhizophagus irregularis]|uniref:Alpha-type protein kinase domain-containing protein n=1 Tax=Rhizophagus irregularis TaxID=588596 RepID=A0A2I1EM91_9GLOM|nr:hypothetical protein RhiirA5_450597 [Rhizophagus irregularis]PKC63909.1 hypothetical protein RhiirA1_518145 [Rhizophagus irregularis]PKY23254.1 hypothetical protein RhiirB3_505403 [Rhizophagus irregularis]